MFTDICNTIAVEVKGENKRRSTGSSGGIRCPDAFLRKLCQLLPGGYDSTGSGTVPFVRLRTLCTGEDREHDTGWRNPKKRRRHEDRDADRHCWNLGDGDPVVLCRSLPVTVGYRRSVCAAHFVGDSAACDLTYYFPEKEVDDQSGVAEKVLYTGSIRHLMQKNNLSDMK